MTHPEHPGALLARTLATLGMSQAELARQTRLTTKHINQVCQGGVGISARSAILLEEATGVDAELWLRLQARHDVFKARKARAGELTETNGAMARAVADIRRALGIEE